MSLIPIVSSRIAGKDWRREFEEEQQELGIKEMDRERHEIPLP